MRKVATSLVVIIALYGLMIMGCDKILGGGGEAPVQQAPVATAPVQPTVPGQQQAVAGQPTAVPGQPAAVPGQPAAVPGQPTAVAGQPTAVAGQPVAVPGQTGTPAATGVPAAAASPAPATPPTPTGDALTDKLNTKKFEVSAEAQPTSTLLKQTLKKNKPQSYEVQLPGPPYCQTFVAAAGDNVKNIDIKLESPTGAQEASDATQENVAVIANHCPTVPGAYKLTVNMPKNDGEFAVQVFSK
jgi:hypothetical protein